MHQWKHLEEVSRGSGKVLKINDSVWIHMQLIKWGYVSVFYRVFVFVRGYVDMLRIE